MTHPVQQRVERAGWWRTHLQARCRPPAPRKSPRHSILISHIMTTVCDYYGFLPDELLSPSRERDLVTARQVAIYLARSMTMRSYPSIGRHFGRDHSTVIHSCKQVTEALERDDEMARDIAAIRRALIDGW